MNREPCKKILKFPPVNLRQFDESNTIDAPESNKINEIIHVLRIEASGRGLKWWFIRTAVCFLSPTCFPSLRTTTDESFPAPTHPAPRVILIFSTFYAIREKTEREKVFRSRIFCLHAISALDFAQLRRDEIFKLFTSSLLHPKDILLRCSYICGILPLPLTNPLLIKA